MINRHRSLLTIVLCAALAGLGVAAFQGTSESDSSNARPPTAAAESPASQADGATFAGLLPQLGDDDWETREDATERLLGLGPTILPELEAALRTASDPEIRRRLEYVIANVTPPERAVLVLRSLPGAGLHAGDTITHFNAARVRTLKEFQARLDEAPAQVELRLFTNGAWRTLPSVPLPELYGQSLWQLPQEVHSRLQPLFYTDYVAPQGDQDAEILRLYDAGLANRAWALLQERESAGSSIPAPYAARIAFTAGAVAPAFAYLKEHDLQKLIASVGNDPWFDPSMLDICGPSPAPFQFVLRLNDATEVSDTWDRRTKVMDIRAQRVYVPANRFAATLADAVRFWQEYRPQAFAPDDRIPTHHAGNMVAIIAWMLYELDLQGECCELIEPRSRALRESPTAGTDTWVRVQVEAWLPFLAGEERRALDEAFRPLRVVLQSRPTNQLIQQPDVAAMLANFLYQFPDDERVSEMLGIVNHRNHPALESYLHWMLFALNRDNLELIREHARAMLPNLSGKGSSRPALWVAALEYISDAPQPAVFDLALTQARLGPAGAQRRSVVALIETMAALHEGDLDRAEAVLRESEVSIPGRAVLTDTIEFRRRPPAGAARFALLKHPLLATHFRRAAPDVWIVVGADRRLLRFDAKAGTLDALPRPTPTWLPNPLVFPWLGRDDAGDHLWVYGRRRIIDLHEDGTYGPRLNVDTEAIAQFDRQARPWYGRVKELAAQATPAPSAECGEFRRDQIHAHAEYVADPSLPELSVVQPLERDPRMLLLGFRGGPQLLIDREGGKLWDSLTLQEALGLDAPVHFQPRALLAQSRPRIMLLSDQGLIEVNVAKGAVRRVELPGPASHPPLVPEVLPYPRRDTRFLYFARPPNDGGAVFRYVVSDDEVQPLELTNVGLTDIHHKLRSRAAIRAELNAILETNDEPPLAAFIEEIDQVMRPQQQAN